MLESYFKQAPRRPSECLLMKQTWWVCATTPVDIGWERLRKVSISDVPEIVRHAAKLLGWEGDVREPECVSFAVPDDVEFAEGFIWKQRNNGTCFVASTVDLPHLHGTEYVKVTIDIQRLGCS